MKTSLYLAMTAAEIHAASSLPAKTAWMACHFSPYSTGLSNLPESLPEGAVLMLNDITPIRGHDPQAVHRQLFDIIGRYSCDALVLDFQRHPSEQTLALAEYLVQAPPCPVAVSALFAKELTCGVLLPPCPPHIPLSEHLAPWSGRDIWLEISQGMESITITASGADVSSRIFSVPEGPCFSEETLHCHYRCESSPSQLCFSLWRTDADNLALCSQAASLGVKGFLGLYQELGDLSAENENRSA